MAPDDAKPEELFAAGKAQHNEPEPPEDLNSDSQGDDSPGDDPAQQEAPEFGSATRHTSHGDSTHNIESGQAGEGGETRWENLPPVDGQQLMADLEAFVGQYLAFPSRHCLVAVCLWIVHTWALFAFYVTPRLIFDSPEPSCGKTRVLEVLALLCRGGKVTMSTTVAALYRRIAQAGDRPPTILQDEADVVFGKTTTLQAEDLRALFNAGYKRGATVDRCEGDPRNMRVRDFPVFAPVALAGLLGKMPATITTRAITIHMRRRAPEDTVRPYRERIAVAEALPLRERIETWAEQNITTLADAWPQMPEGVEDRPAEVWEALLAIADAVGGDWPDRARAACRYFVLDSDSDDKLSLGLRLLRDIKDVFGGQDRMFSLHLVSGLIANSEWEWSDLWGKSLDQRRLAKELKRYGVEPYDIRIGDVVRKGVHRRRRQRAGSGVGPLPVSH